MTPSRHIFARKREPVVPVSALTPQQVRSQRTLAWSALAVGVLGFLIILPFTLYGWVYLQSWLLQGVCHHGLHLDLE